MNWVSEEKKIRIGDKASLARTITEADVVNFSQVSWDHNPVHMNEEYATKTLFKGRIVHGMLGVSLLSAVMGTTLPGPGAIYISQEVKFLAPIRIGDTVKAEVEVLQHIEKGNKLVLSTNCYTQSGALVIQGQAIVKLV